ncbi:SMP-30/gluconolactonase/LRE family protein [Microbacterium sp. X-17]|uniref:SMP-30/gluconolactonase/LRE family protein n=1 Tax=Microbacterium sp. X-17 TaxID=3144404 RepID=UPI0031F52EDE
MAHEFTPAGPVDTTLVRADLHFPEGARIGPDGALYVSDVYAYRVLRIDLATGQETTVAEVPGQPCGLGWLPDGRLLIVSMRDRMLLRLEPDGRLVVHADLGAVTAGAINDLFVDAAGRAWVSDFGFDYYGLIEADPDVDPLFGENANPPSAHLTLVEPDGTVRSAAGNLRFPNGVVVLDAGVVLVAETLGARLTAFDIAPDGTLSGRRVWADLSDAGPGGSPVAPDGLSIGPVGAVWVADPGNGGAVLVAEGGAVRRRVQASQSCFSVAQLPDGRVLCCTAATSKSDLATAHAWGRLELGAAD